MTKTPVSSLDLSLIAAALAEDIGPGDITSELTVPADARCRARLVAKSAGVLCGMPLFRGVFDAVDSGVGEWSAMEDGAAFHNSDEVAAFTGRTRAVLAGERTALNFVQHLSGVATLTRRFADALAGLDARVCDTRKTTPGLRVWEKRAVRYGGGVNHRHALFDGILIKENHIAAAGGVAAAVKAARAGAHHLLKIEVEVRDLDELAQALDAGVDAVLLDNMPHDTLRQAVEQAWGRDVVLEASGNVTLETVRQVAESGVDLVSVGALTHSAPAADLSLLIEAI